MKAIVLRAALLVLASSSSAWAQTQATVSAGNGSVVEGNTGTRNLDFPVLRSGDSTSNVVVPYSVTPGTAAAGTDYVVPPVNSVARIPAGMPQGTASVQVIGDTATEGNETLTIHLGQPAAYGPTGGFPQRIYFDDEGTSALTNGTALMPSAIATGDFNNDGLADVATANRNSGNVSIFLRTGSATFAAPTNITVGSTPTAIAAGRFNSDAFTDLAVVNENSNSISILLANGSGGFSVTTLAAGTDPRSVAVADLNGDGKADLIVANTADDNVSVRLGNGSGGFGAAANFATGQGPEGLAIADFSGDGKLDLMVGNGDSLNITVLPGNGSGAFGAPTVVPLGGSNCFCQSIAAGDFNGDGKPDFAAVDFGNLRLFIGINNGSGGFTVRFPYSTPLARHVSVADFTGDGFPDLAVVLRDAGDVLLLAGDGHGDFSKLPVFDVGLQPSSAVVGDFTGDGKPDLAVANAGDNTPDSATVQILAGIDPPAGFTAFKVGDSDSQPRGVAVGDFNRDGKPDIAATALNFTNSSVSVFLGDGAGEFGSETRIVLCTDPRNVVTADFNGDSKPDLAVACTALHSVGILIGDGAGGFVHGTDPVLSNAPNQIALGDFNGDGKVDIVGVTGAGNASVVLGNGSGGFAAATNFPTGASSSIAVAVGDVNGDGKADLVVANPAAGNFSVLLGNGTGGFGAASIVSGSTGLAIGLTDFNGDGKLDVVLTGSDPGGTLVLPGTGTGAFGAPVPTPETGSALAFGDFNGDGRQDVVIGAGPFVNVLLGNGSGGFNGSGVFTAGETIRAIGVGDFNRDGKADLATANLNGGDVSVLLGSSTTTAVLGTSTATGTILDDEDVTPGSFAFTAATNVPINTVSTSNTVTISGLSSFAPISVTGGSYSIGCNGAFTTSSGSIGNSQTVCVRQTSSTSFSTSTTATLTVGTFSAGYTITTVADSMPDAFHFVDQANVVRSSVRTSNTVTITGIATAAPISVTGGTYSIGCTTTFTATASTISNNQTVCVRHTASSGFSTAVNTTLTVGGVADTFTSTTVAPDTTPDAFTFVDQTGVPISTVRTSNAVTIAGIEAAAPISVVGGTYSIGCTASFTATAGTIAAGQTVCVRHTSSANTGTAVNSTLTVGGVSDTFTSTTEGVDTTPDQFTFIDQSGLERDSVVISNTITISGINSPAPISITNGAYSIGCTGNNFTGSTSTISNGQTVCVRTTTGGIFGQTTPATLTVGGVSDVFSATNRAADTTPDVFTFVDQVNVPTSSVRTSNAVTISGLEQAAPISITGGLYSVGCTNAFVNGSGAQISNGQTICVQHTASANASTAVSTTLTIGGVSDTFTSTTAADTTPDAFAFTDQPNVPRSSVRTSNTVTITGISTAVPIAVTGGAYSIGCGATFTATAGTIASGQTVCVRHTSSGSFSTAVDTTLTVGGVPDTFTSTTAAPDTTPDAFHFTGLTGVPLNSVRTSTATISGIDSPAPVSVTGGTYSIGCTATFTATAGTITNGQTVCVRHTSSSSFSTSVTTTLTIGGVSAGFTTTTIHDTVPDAFAFVDQANVPRSSERISAPVTIAGIDAAAAISVTGGTYSIGCTSTFTGSAGTISNGQTVCVRNIASSSFSTAVNTTLTVGGVADTFTSTTLAADTTPDAFSFIDQQNVPRSSVRTSNSVGISGIDSPAPISVVGGTYSINCSGTFTAAAGTISSGQTVCVQHTASGSFSTAVNTTLTVGGVPDTFTSTTAAADTTPNAFSFVDQQNVPRSSVRTSNSVAISGIDSATPISVVGGTYSIGCNGTFTASAGTITSGQAVCVQHTASGSFSTAVNTTLTVGGVFDTFTSTTVAADTTPDAFGFSDQTGVPRSTVRTSNAVTISGIDSAAPISVAGGTYSVGCTGTFTAAAGTINSGQTVCVQHTASGSFSTAVNTTLTIGGVSDTFTSTTVAADTSPDAFGFASQIGVVRSSVRTSNVITITGIEAAAPISVTNGSYSIGCTGSFTVAAATIDASQTVCVQHTASPSFSTSVVTTLTVGGVAGTFTSTTLDADTTPDAFAFIDQAGVLRSSVRTSNTVQINGLNTNAPISVAGGTYSIGCTASFTAAAGTIGDGQMVCVQHTASSGFSTAVNTTLTVGGVSDTFTSTTAAADTTPDAFSFVNQSDVPVNTLRISSVATITGIDAPAPISVVNGSYSIGCTATFTQAAATIAAGQTVCVRHQSASQFVTARTTTLTIGGVSGAFTTTTVAGDTTPDPFSFVDQQDVPRNSVRSASVAITGISAAAPISIVGGTYSIGCAAGGYTFAAGKVSPGGSVCVRHTASGTFGTSVNTTLTVGGVSDIFTSTTVNDTTPDAFSFVDQPDVPRNNVRVSNAVTIGGISGPAKISVTGGTYSIGCTATFTSAAGTIDDGQTVCVRQTSAATFSTAKNTVLTVGGASDTFTSTTVADPGS